MRPPWWRWKGWCGYGRTWLRQLSDNVFVLMTVVTVVNLMALIMSKSIPVRTRSNASLSYTVIPPDSKYWLWDVVLDDGNAGWKATKQFSKNIEVAVKTFPEEAQRREHCRRPPSPLEVPAVELLSFDVGQGSLEDPTRLQLSLEDFSLLLEDLPPPLQPLAVGAPLLVDQILLKQFLL